MTREEEIRMLVECRLSGQVSDAQWHQHVAEDPALAAHIEAIRTAATNGHGRTRPQSAATEQFR